MRDVHVLTGRRGSKYPSLIVGAAADYAYKEPVPEAITRDYLCKWGALAWYRRRGDVYSGRQEQQGAAAYIHSELQRLCRHGASVWLFAPGMHKLLIALGVYDAIDGTTWKITEEAGPVSGASQRRRRADWSGYCCVEDRVTILVVRSRQGGVLHAVDTSNFMANLGRGTAETCLQSARRAVEWARGWVALLHDAGLGTLQHTLAAQSMYAYRRRLPQVPIVVHNHQPALDLERAALYGGRAECFQIGVCTSRGLAQTTTSHYGGVVPCWSGVGPMYHLDARSLYGAIAARTMCPVVIRGYADYADGNGSIPDVPSIADVTVTVDSPVVPFRPFIDYVWIEPDGDRKGHWETRERHGPKIVIFPTGTFRTTLAGPELAAIGSAVSRVWRVSRYDTADIFSSWADRCWKLRQAVIQNGDTELTGTIKSFGQVLYGKWGQRQRGWRHVPGVQSPDRWALWWQVDRDTKEPCAWRSIAGRVERHVDAGETRDSCPAITAWINSAARVWLWRLMNDAGRRNVLYCDTDSVIVTEAGYDAIIAAGYVVGDGLGELRVVGVHERVEVCGVKHYITDGIVTCAGIPPRAKSTRGQIDAHRHEEPLGSACRARRPPLAREVIRSTERVREYRHGNVELDGRVTPYHFEEQPSCTGP